MVTFVLGQRRVVREPSGWGHFFIFWGFIIITIGSLETFGVGLYHGFAYWKVLGKPFTAVLYLLQDLLCAGVIVALYYALHRRFVVKPERLRFRDQQAADLDASIIIGMILVLIVAAVRGPGRGIPAGPDRARPLLPLTAFISVISLRALCLAVGAAPLGMVQLFWWGHTLVILGFLVYIPFSKHLHLLGAIPNVFFRRFRPIGELTKMDLEDESVETYGVSKIEEFTWKQNLDLYACTECGRCSENCPANLTGKPLSPKETIHNLKKHLLAKGKLLARSRGGQRGQAAAGAPEELSKAMVGEVCLPDEIWSCTTCGNCMEHCPVFIEHIQKYVDMRRYLVLMESNFPPEVQTVLRNWETNSNPWGLAFATRGDWAKGLEVQTLAENPEVEYLFYVGCTGSFDERGKKVTCRHGQAPQPGRGQFRHPGGRGEVLRRDGPAHRQRVPVPDHGHRTGGNHQRLRHQEDHHHLSPRLQLPEERVPPIRRQLGGLPSHRVSGPARCRKGACSRYGRLDKRLTFHDSCYLGRYNDLYEEPRGILKAIPGLRLSEMERHHNKSFCCGAGGGRMWMEETLGNQKINEARTDQALALDPGAHRGLLPLLHHHVGGRPQGPGPGRDGQGL